MSALDQREVSLHLSGDEADRDTALTRTTGASDPVHVVVRRPWKIIVDDRRQPRDVEPACGEVGRDEDVDVRRTEHVERSGAGALAEPTVECHRVDARSAELRRDVLGRVGRRDEHEHALPRVLLEKMTQQLGPPRRIDLDRALLDGRQIGRRIRDIDRHWRSEQALRHPRHRPSKRRREQQCLTARRK